MNDESMVVFADGHSVTEAFYKRILECIRNLLSTRVHGRRYTAEELCGVDVWAGFDNGQRRLAGRCVARMVCAQVLPLRFVPGKHEYPKYYMLKGQD